MVPSSEPWPAADGAVRVRIPSVGCAGSMERHLLTSPVVPRWSRSLSVSCQVQCAEVSVVSVSSVLPGPVR